MGFLFKRGAFTSIDMVVSFSLQKVIEIHVVIPKSLSVLSTEPVLYKNGCRPRITAFESN